MPLLLNLFPVLQWDSDHHVIRLHECKLISANGVGFDYRPASMNSQVLVFIENGKKKKYLLNHTHRNWFSIRTGIYMIFIGADLL